jgi:hypothetical protein
MKCAQVYLHLKYCPHETWISKRFYQIFCARCSCISYVLALSNSCASLWSPISSWWVEMSWHIVITTCSEEILRADIAANIVRHIRIMIKVSTEIRFAFLGTFISMQCLRQKHSKVSITSVGEERLTISCSENDRLQIGHSTNRGLVDCCPIIERLAYSWRWRESLTWLYIFWNTGRFKRWNSLIAWWIFVLFFFLFWCNFRVWSILLLYPIIQLIVFGTEFTQNMKHADS